MKAAVVGEKGVEIRDVAKPVPKAHEILITVRAASPITPTSRSFAAIAQHGAYCLSDDVPKAWVGMA